MSVPEPPANSDPRTDPTPGDAASAKPWAWIALAGLLAVGIVALAVYAINVNSDLDDANAKIASQQKQIDQAHETGARAGVLGATAKAAYDDLSAKLGAAQESASHAVEQASEQLDEAEQAAAEAEGTAEELRTEAEAAQAKAASAATCAQSFLSAFSGVFDAPTPKEGVEATVAELKALHPQCASALDQDGAGS